MSSPKSTAVLAESRALLALAWPIVIAHLAQIGTGVVDTIMAGHYHSSDLAAVAIGYNIWLPLYLFVIGVSLGATYIIAQHAGAGRTGEIRNSLPQALWLALALGLVVGPICFGAAPLLNVLGLDPNTSAKSLGYLQAVAFGLPAAALFEALRCHGQGVGVMRPFAAASVVTFLANIPLNYALMYGRWGLPELGAAGCGWATAVSMWLGTAVLFFYMTRAEALRRYMPPWRLVAPRLEAIGEIVRLGLPLGFTLFLEIAFFSVITLCIATLGEVAVGAHQVAFSMWDIVYMPLISFGSALAIRCGIGMTMLVGLLGMALLLASPAFLVSLFTSDREIAAMAVILVRLAALFILIDAAQVAASYSLRAFKDTRFAFFALCLAYWLIALPLGYWRGIMTADSALDGTIAFWQSLIAGITVTSVLVFARLYHTLRKQRSTA
jgi:multidrug resistance protein, MATE family